MSKFEYFFKVFFKNVFCSNNYMYLCVTLNQKQLINNTKNLIIMNAQEFISNEMNIRIKLVEDVKFRELCVKVCKELGISAKIWNENKMDICLHIANQFIGLDTQGDGKLRAYLEK